MEVPMDHQGLLYGVTISPQRLSYGSTHGSFRAIIWGYPWVLKVYTMRVPMGPQSLYYAGTHGSSRAIIWGYPKVLKRHLNGVSIDPQDLLYSGTPRS